MKEITSEKLTSHELTRRQIAQQVDRFIKNGGKIEAISSLDISARPIAQGWRPQAGSFES